MAQQFVVPQFIEVEDKIFGPITTRQFLILLSDGILIFLFYRYADFALFVTMTVLFGGIGLLFAFVKINGQTFHYFLLNIVQTLRNPSLRIWSKVYTKKELEFYRTFGTDIAVEEVIERKKVKRQHIRDLSLIVNTGGYFRSEDHL